MGGLDRTGVALVMPTPATQDWAGPSFFLSHNLSPQILSLLSFSSSFFWGGSPAASQQAVILGVCGCLALSG